MRCASPFSHCLAHQPLTALLADTHHFIQDGLDWMMLAIMIIHENYHLMITHYGLAICCQSYRPTGICLEMEAFALKFFVLGALPPPPCSGELVVEESLYHSPLVTVVERRTYPS